VVILAALVSANFEAGREEDEDEYDSGSGVADSG
jgi:hypothetical protein